MQNKISTVYPIYEFIILYCAIGIPFLSSQSAQPLLLWPLTIQAAIDGEEHSKSS